MTETKPKREDIAKTPAAKSRSKAAGLKSTFAVNGSVLLTSFGRDSRWKNLLPATAAVSV